MKSTKAILFTAFLTLCFFCLPQKAPAARTLTIMYFDNNSGQKDYDALGKGLADMLITDLTKYSGLEVVERARLEKLLEELKLQQTKYFDPQTAVRVGRGLGADLALTGAFFVTGTDMRIDTRVVDIATGKILAAEKVTGPTDRFFDLQVRLVEVFVKGLGRRLSGDQQSRLAAEAQKSGADRLATAALYSEGLDLADRGDYQAASQKLEQVLQEDPGFTLAKTRQDEILKKIYETAKRIEAKTDRLVQAMEKISQGFAALEKKGSVIPSPKTPEEFYYNARLYELGGDYGNARRAYMEYFKFNLDFVDPHLRFLLFLKVQEGREGAREVYGYIRKASTGFAADFAFALLLDRERRIAALKDLAAQHPDFAPVYYELSQDYSEARVGRQTLEDREKEKEYLDKFTELDRSGKLVRYFLDKEMVAEIRQDAEERLAALNLLSQEAVKNPVHVSWMKTNSGWIGNISIAELALEIFYRLETDPDFKSLGHQEYLNPQTGHKVPVQTITLPFTEKPVRLFVKYTDIHQKQRGPFPAVLDPQAADIASTKRILELTKNSWVAFGRNNLLYFSHLMSYRGAIEEIHYSLDSDTPATKYNFPPFDGPGTALVSGDVPIYIKIPKKTKYITVKLTFKDGTSSEVVRIDRR